jgi:hypothetical protein
LLAPTFFGRPSGIASYLWKGFVTEGRLWTELGYTLLGAGISFLGGSICAIALGLIFVEFPRFHRAAEPYLTLLNAMPRIALAPLFLLWFGLGIGSKVAVGFSLTFFIVLSATIAGIRGTDQDYLVLSRSLGATPSQIFFNVTLPSAVPVSSICRKFAKPSARSGTDAPRCLRRAPWNGANPLSRTAANASRPPLAVASRPFHRDGDQNRYRSWFLGIRTIGSRLSRVVRRAAISNLTATAGIPGACVKSALVTHPTGLICVQGVRSQQDTGDQPPRSRAPLAQDAFLLLMIHLNPTWLAEVSIASACRAAGR